MTAIVLTAHPSESEIERTCNIYNTNTFPDTIVIIVDEEHDVNLPSPGDMVKIMLIDHIPETRIFKTNTKGKNKNDKIARLVNTLAEAKVSLFDIGANVDTNRELIIDNYIYVNT